MVIINTSISQSNKGKIYKSNNYGYFVILNEPNRGDNIIMFIDTGTIVEDARMYNIERGLVKDVYAPNVHGVGYIGYGKYTPRRCPWLSKIHGVWRNMIERCYSTKTKNLSYKNHTVCDEWHNFQNFAKWFEDNYIEGYELDKDKLQPNTINKVYSPNTCCFLSKSENAKLITRKPRAKPVDIISPDGTKYTVSNRKEFCDEHDLLLSGISSLVNKRLKSHRGWKLC